jgi:hypothetical protein
MVAPEEMTGQKFLSCVWWATWKELVPMPGRRSKLLTLRSFLYHQQAPVSRSLIRDTLLNSKSFPGREKIPPADVSAVAGQKKLARKVR